GFRQTISLSLPPSLSLSLSLSLFLSLAISRCLRGVKDRVNGGHCSPLSWQMRWKMRGGHPRPSPMTLLLLFLLSVSLSLSLSLSLPLFLSLSFKQGLAARQAQKL